MTTKYCNAYKLQLVREPGLPRWERTPMCGPESAAEGIKKVFENMDREAFAVIALNTRNSMIAYNIVSIGSLSASIVHPREVFKFAILANASSILLAHNHPSGDPSPSRDDIELTSRFVKAGKMMGIEVLDHLIIGEETLSLKERGLM